MWEGAQVDIGHHYLAMSRREFELERVTPVDYGIPQSIQDALKIVRHSPQPQLH